MLTSQENKQKGRFDVNDCTHFYMKNVIIINKPDNLLSVKSTVNMIQNVYYLFASVPRGVPKV